MEKSNSPQEELRNKYSKIFKNTYPSVGDGWIPYIDKMCELLEFHIKHNDHPQVEASQVK